MSIKLNGPVQIHLTAGERRLWKRLAFRRSGLMRPKWDRLDYRHRTIATAIGGRLR